MNSSPNIVVVSNCTPRDVLCLKPLVSKFPELILVKPDYSSLTKKNVPFLTRCQEWYRSKRQGIIQRMIRRSARSSLANASLPKKNLLAHQDFFTQKGVDYFTDLKPDILITCNAPLLPERIFSIPPLGSFNVHFGIAPYYRGNHTLFFALKNKDHKNIGACLHRLSKGIDTGALLFRVYPEILPRYSEIDLHIALANAAGALLLKFAQFLPESAQSPGLSQSDKGQLFTNSSRSFLEDLSCPFFLSARADTTYREEIYF